MKIGIDNLILKKCIPTKQYRDPVARVLSFSFFQFPKICYFKGNNDCIGDMSMHCYHTDLPGIHNRLFH